MPGISKRQSVKAASVVIEGQIGSRLDSCSDPFISYMSPPSTSTRKPNMTSSSKRYATLAPMAAMSRSCMDRGDVYASGGSIPSIKRAKRSESRLLNSYMSIMATHPVLPTSFNLSSQSRSLTSSSTVFAFSSTNKSSIVPKLRFSTFESNHDNHKQNKPNQETMSHHRDDQHQQQHTHLNHSSTGHLPPHPKHNPFQHNRKNHHNLNVGKAIDILQREIPEFFDRGITDRTIYSRNVHYTDPLHFPGWKLKGHMAYLGMAGMLRWFCVWYYDGPDIDIVRLRQCRGPFLGGGTGEEGIAGSGEGGVGGVGGSHHGDGGASPTHPPHHHPKPVGLETPGEVGGAGDELDWDCTSPETSDNAVRVVVRWVFEGTPRYQVWMTALNPLFVPKPTVYEGVFVYRFDEDGLIEEHRLQSIHPAPPLLRFAKWLNGGVRARRMGGGEEVPNLNTKAKRRIRPAQSIQQSTATLKLGNLLVGIRAGCKEKRVYNTHFTHKYSRQQAAYHGRTGTPKTGKGAPRRRV
ncbi:hypothetical protein HDU76_007311 [Blyttiomyces sp. JEL0837]|nr:hypothetical protein HDU76_007311 [Blyttiomyces sp. JEL0837]